MWSLNIVQLACFVNIALCAVTKRSDCMGTNHKPMYSDMMAHDGFNLLKTEINGTIKNYLYLPSSEKAKEDETVVIWTTSGDLFASSDQGHTWHKVVDIPNVKNVYASTTEDSQLVVFSDLSTTEDTVWFSYDRGVSFQIINLPATIQGASAHTFKFHPTNPDIVLFQGYKDCDDPYKCFANLYLSKNRGKTWQVIQTNIFDCDFPQHLINPISKDFIFCLEGKSLTDISQDRYLYSEDFFASGAKAATGITAVQKVAEVGGYLMAIAVKIDDGDVVPELFVTSDGKHFDAVRYPPNIPLDPAQGLTTINTEGKSIMLYESMKLDDGTQDSNFGILLRSDERGTDFSVVLKNLNRAPAYTSGYVDFDNLKSVEGVSIANVVTNPDEIAKQGAEKRIKTVITHSDGAFWDPIPAPDKMCTTSDCSLHLHGYIERLNFRNQPSSPYAVGMFIGRGNVGETLGEFRTSQTFMTRDAGITWTKIHDRPTFWTYLDSGSIIVLAEAMEPTDSVSYSTDGGVTWNQKTIFDYKVKIMNLATMPTDTSMKLLVFAQPPVSYGDVSLVFHLDFSETFKTQCKAKDYELWTPQHPHLKSECLLGHKSQYERKILDHKCYVGKKFLVNDDTSLVGKPTHLLENCKCTRQDYECDFGYELNEIDGTCVQIPGFKTPSMEEMCLNDAVSWFSTNGYRKLERSTCEGGEMLEDRNEYACPGKEDEFNRQRSNYKNDGQSGSGKSTLAVFIFFFVLICTIIFIGIFKYQGGFSSIRLQDVADMGDRYDPQLQKVKYYAETAIAYIADFVMSLPFIESRAPHDRMGFYTRMDNDERYRILDEEEGFYDSEEDRNDDDEIDDDTVDNESSSSIPGPSTSTAASASASASAFADADTTTSPSPGIDETVDTNEDIVQEHNEVWKDDSPTQ